VPLYEYECLPEHHRFEVRHGMNESPIAACEVCGGEVRRVIHPVGIVFKGSGFYATDSRETSKASKAAAPAGEKSSPAKTESKSESPPPAPAADSSKS